MSKSCFKRWQILHQQLRSRGAPQAAGGGGAQRGQSGGSAGEGPQPPAFVAGGGTSGPCGEGTQKPSRRRETGPDKSPLHGCKSPRCCYFIYRCPREDCLLLQNFKLPSPPPLFLPFPPVAASGGPRSHSAAYRPNPPALRPGGPRLSLPPSLCGWKNKPFSPETAHERLILMSG